MEKRSFRSVPARLALLALAMLGAALLSLCLGAAEWAREHGGREA